MKDEEYELMPHKEIIELRKEIEHLKKNPLGKGRSSKDLLDSVNELTDSINSLIYTFKHATDELKKEEKPEKDDSLLAGKLDKLIEQNKELAEGIVSVAHMIKKEDKEIQSFGERVKQPQEPISRPQQPQMYSRPQQTPPPGDPNQMPQFQKPDFSGIGPMPPDSKNNPQKKGMPPPPRPWDKK